MGGETIWTSTRPGRLEGLSPRGRGNRVHALAGLRLKRSIPAWAGKPGRHDSLVVRRGVYPRVGGETGRRAASMPSKGSIPAWAGKPKATIAE